MVIAVDLMHGSGPNNNFFPVTAKKDKGKAVLLMAAKGVIRTLHYQQNRVL